MRYRLLLLSCVALAQAAQGQRTDDNATTAAEDAFGKSVGDQSIGIYNPYDVRGFSPVDAGNVRIEGLYFDQQSGLSNRISDGSTIRVGLSAQSYPFPAPTGIADFTLRKAGKDALASFALNYGPWQGKEAEVDVQLPIDGERLGIAAGAGLYRDGRPYGGTPHDVSAGASLHWGAAPGNRCDRLLEPAARHRQRGAAADLHQRRIPAAALSAKPLPRAGLGRLCRDRDQRRGGGAQRSARLRRAARPVSIDQPDRQLGRRPAVRQRPRRIGRRSGDRGRK